MGIFYSSPHCKLCEFFFSKSDSEICDNIRIINSNEFIYKTETESRHRKQANGCQKGDEEGKDE